MTPTLEYVKQKFDEFNKLCFGGKLPELPFKLSNARTFLGQVRFFQEKNDDGTWHYYGFVFCINTKWDLPEDVIEDTILHEMIHYWIGYNQMQDNAPHGDYFLQKMQEINREHNRNITISHKATKEEHDKDTEVRQHFLCVTHFKNNKWGVAIATRSSLFRLWDELAQIPDIAEQKWYITTNPFFNRIPRAVTPKLYRITKAELDANLADARELERRGANIIEKRK